MGNHSVSGICCVLCGHDKTVGRKLCKSCYYKEKRKGTLENFPQATLADSFMNRVSKTEECWNWTGTKHQYGYGVVVINNKSIRAHRYSYELHKGAIPDGLVVMHSCDNPSCVNPDHLSLGTRLDNNRDAKEKGRNATGERNGQSKLSNSTIEEIRSLVGIKNTYIATIYNIDPSHVSRIRNGRRRASELETGFKAPPIRKVTRLTLEQIASIKSMQGTQKQIAEKFNIAQGTVSQIKTGKYKRSQS